LIMSEKNIGQRYKMNKYDGMSAPELFLEYSLEVLHSCLTPHGFSEAQESFGRLESMLTNEKVQTEISEKVQRAKSILTEMKSKYGLDANPFSEEYVEPLTEMRDLLLETQQEFEQNYKGE
jgi:hypothetical protein